MSTPTVEIKQKSAGPEGTTEAPGPAAVLAQPVTITSGFKVVLVPFILEDYLDAIEARAALEDPENREHIPWEQLRDKLGL
jgi:hypothetical protein